MARRGRITVDDGTGETSQGAMGQARGRFRGLFGLRNKMASAGGKFQDRAKKFKARKLPGQSTY